MDGIEAAGQHLADECRRLVDRLAGTTGNWFAAHVVGGGMTREEQLRELVRTLADIGRDAGSGAPAGAVPRDVGVHALGDQITVLVHDIRLAAGSAAFATAVTAASTAVSSCYDALWSPLTP
jgi:hypothetical protein